jgi:glycolate oxidase iron-sulfur subunit
MSKAAPFSEIKRFEKDLGQCMKCGFCAHWCPVFREDHLESSVARGKNMIIRGLLSGELDYTAGYRERINKCTLCMTCAANCPAKTNIPDVIVAARADMTEARGLQFPYSVIYRHLLPRRKLFGNIVRLAAQFQNILLPPTEGDIRHLPMFLSALGKGRNIPSIAPKFLRQMVPEFNMPSGDIKPRMVVGYFTGCMTDFVFPETGKQVIDFLNRNGVGVIVPREQGCCGAPVYLGAGDFETGRKIADINIAAFEDVDYIITDCATCASALVDYKKFLSDNPEREKSYGKFSSKVRDISQFLVDVLQLPPSAYKAAPWAKGKKVTWHDPCHLVRHLGVKEQPRTVLKLMKDIEYVEMPNADQCCGMAGSFSISHYEISKKIADRKAQSIRATGADIVVTSCPGCELQLIDSMLRNNMRVIVRNIADLLN